MENLAMCEEELPGNLSETGRGCFSREIRCLTCAAWKVFLLVCSASKCRSLGISSGTGKSYQERLIPGNLGQEYLRSPEILREWWLYFYLKITGVDLKVKTILDEEKTDQIRIYSGSKYELVQRFRRDI